MTTPTTSTTDLLTLHPDDDVAVVLTDGRAGVPAGHKVARRALPAGTLVHKYGQVIGVSTAPIREGEHVHTHNLAMPGERLRAAAPAGAPDVRAADAQARTFRGYLRADGRVGTRNFIGVLTSVNCSATVARQIARRFEFEPLPGVDGVVALTHGSGCGMADRGPGWEVLRRTLAGYARHPNIGGIVVVGLGCEVNDLSSLVAGLGVGEHVPVESYSIQDVGGTAAAVAQGDRLVRSIAERLARDTRTEVGMENLVLGLQCGGSDGWSGLTANPALGVASDLVVAAGGTSMLGETPEIYGAEHLLAARAVDEAVAAALLDRITWWERYTADQGTTLDGNPSPGNKAGGITTILEKSLGAVAKAGRSPLVEVVDYAATPTRAGMVFMDTPGYDPVSATGMVAGGATLIAFTTGRGSVFGSRPVPTVKLASNSAMAARMAEDIDLDCGPVATGGVALPEMGERVLDVLLEVASGKPSASEELGLGGEEMVPWQLGAVL
ncbi:UxaA family hydrolase [Pseudonocardia humida]|uniref:Altronate dehydratase n=1 Tax=Pseudonocardia humida TaxID=2800819 RepID=A0ABT1A6J5_9PSEU|nr:altronate dehydratase family protein [Pseudonocardia humida]MCO1658620.1 altronate dehydratase [Pseudonocardia humida]